jgi:phage shock protein A
MLTEQIASLERKHQEESALLIRRVNEAERSVRDFEAAGFAGDLRTQTSIDQLKEKYSAAVSLLDARLRSEGENVKALSMKLRNSESMIAELLEEKSSLARLAEEAQQEVKHQDAQLSSCRATISDLAGQLSSSHQAREDGALRAARYDDCC